MPLEPDQSVTVVMRRESFMFFPLMLEYALKQIARHANIERATAAGHNVCKVAAIVHVAYRMLKR